MQQLGKVLSLEKGWAVLEITRPQACRGCGMCQPSSNAKRVKAICETEVEPGDYVVVEMKDGDVLKAAGIAYGLPLLGFLAGIVTGNGVAGYFGMKGSSDLFSVIGGFTFLALTYFGVRKYDMGLDKRSFCPKVTGKADPGEVSCPGRTTSN
ncbi:MAG TPA: SoxR reducing system RseC family protein [Bacillota bacterium]|nr:SoxR reducing system RseC family protein [Bacillota bacterium]HOH10129.1 SoxR reducing system RseC family protein [Bacillota bacterium]HOS50451.1 SoxR reducing system RseC family protein [Bacillota bacterium]HOY88576.1 SoxR reducing system RseC family protein [Bacillota bacterium]HPI01105.1 SoxR reducing system RseC family protein [Bacillota bacterium]